MSAAEVLKSVPQPSQAPVQAPPQPAQPPPAAAQAPAEDPKFQLLAKREAEIVRRGQQIKQIEAQLKAEREALTARGTQYQDYESLKKNPEKVMKFLEANGLTYNDLTQFQLNNGQIPPEVQFRQVNDEIAALKKAREEEKAQEAERAQANARSEEEAITNSFKSEISKFQEGNKTKYPLTHLHNDAELVYSTIDHHYQTTLKERGVGEVMEINKAFELVEAYRERLLGEAQKLKTPAVAPSVYPAKRFAVHDSPVWKETLVKTLTNDIQATTPSQQTRFLSDDERVSNAIAKLKAAKQARGM